MSQLKVVDELITTGFVFQLYFHHPYFKSSGSTKKDIRFIEKEPETKFKTWIKGEVFSNFVCKKELLFFLYTFLNVRSTSRSGGNHYITDLKKFCTFFFLFKSNICLP